MIEEREKRISQVKKMFALAGNNPSEDEANTAMIMAQNLMHRYNLSQAEINIEKAPEVCDIPVDNDSRCNIPYWQKRITYVITKNLKCSSYFQSINGRWTIKIVGLEGDVEICKATVDFAFRHYQNSWKSFLKYNLSADIYSTRAKTNAKKNDFTEGFITGLEKAFEKNVEEKGLIIVQPAQVKKRMRSLNLKRIPRAKRSFTNDDEAILAGYNAGLNSKKSETEAIA